MKRIFFGTIVLISATTINLSAMKQSLNKSLGDLTQKLHNLSRSLSQKVKTPLNLPQPEEMPGAFATHGLLIFLDDSDKGTYTISSNFLQALMSQAGPTIVSASLVANILNAGTPQATDIAKLSNLMQHKAFLAFSLEERTATMKTVVSIGLSTINFAQEWIIKEIDPLLYLFLPISYLQSKGINSAYVKAFSPGKDFSATELALGLKVNHMKTVLIKDIKEPRSTPAFATYFIDALPSIFVTKRDYPVPYKPTIPTWAIYINGHGSMNYSITYLSLAQFKTFLTFLADKIRTKLLFYDSCYAAGKNTEILYKDTQKGIDATYPFVIITRALIDSAIVGASLSWTLSQGKVTVTALPSLSKFVQQVTKNEIINYRNLMAPFIEYLQEPQSIVPQIKLPGISWFSVIDSEKIANIGSILAKNRTKPLDIATFFARKGKKANPLGILFHAANIPFELIINTATMPVMFSMIPGEATHTLKKVSSSTHAVDAILNSFLIPYTMPPRKIFVIDEITGPFSDELSRILGDKGGTLSDVAITTVVDREDKIYFTHKGAMYAASNILTNENSAAKATALQRMRYRRLLDEYRPKKN